MQLWLWQRHDSSKETTSSCSPSFERKVNQSYTMMIYIVHIILYYSEHIKLEPKPYEIPCNHSYDNEMTAHKQEQP